jgi:hypothetical protein
MTMDGLKRQATTDKLLCQVKATQGGVVSFWKASKHLFESYLRFILATKQYHYELVLANILNRNRHVRMFVGP